MDSLKYRYETRVRKQQMLIEAFDKKTVEKSIQLIRNLSAIKWPGELVSFKEATTNAISELKHAIAGENRSKGLVDKLLSLFSHETDNPFLDVIAYASAMKQFFSTLFKLASSLGDDQKTLGEIFHDDEDVLKKIIAKGLRPEGKLASIKTNWQKKYLKTDINDLIDQLSKLKTSDLKTLSQNITTALSNASEIADQVAAAETSVINQREEPTTTKTAQPQAETPAAQTTGTVQTKENPVMPGHQNHEPAEIQSGEDVVQAVTRIAGPKLQKAGVKNPDEVIDILNGLGFIKISNK